MKLGSKIAWLWVWACATSSAISAPPTTVAGMKFFYAVYGRDSYDSTQTVLLLNSDGTYTGLRQTEVRARDIPGGAQLMTRAPVVVDESIPENGTWSYQILDSDTAEIVITRRSIRLRFSKSHSGYSTDLQAGEGLIQFEFIPYDATTRLANTSTRSFLAPGRTVYVGFVITAGERRVLVRAVGPGLGAFGVASTLNNPRLVVRPAGGGLPVDFFTPSNVVTRATLDRAAQRAGAFPLPSASDQAKYLTLKEGSYIAEVFSSDSAASGEVLIEVYQMP